MVIKISDPTCPRLPSNLVHGCKLLPKAGWASNNTEGPCLMLMQFFGYLFHYCSFFRYLVFRPKNCTNEISSPKNRVSRISLECLKKNKVMKFAVMQFAVMKYA